MKDDIPVDGSIPTEGEVEKVLSTFKNNKNWGTDKLKTEGLKYNDNKNLVTAIITLMIMVKIPYIAQ